MVSDGIGASTMTATLTWTAPGDDGDTGSITGGEFEIRYSTIGVISDLTDFSTAPFSVAIATSVNPGELQTYIFENLYTTHTYHFALTTKDGLGIRSEVSNAVTAESYM